MASGCMADPFPSGFSGHLYVLLRVSEFTDLGDFGEPSVKTLGPKVQPLRA